MKTRKYRRTLKKGGMDRIKKMLGYSTKPTKKRQKKQKPQPKPLTSEERESKLLESTLDKMSKAFKEEYAILIAEEKARKEEAEAEKIAIQQAEADRKAREGNMRKAEEDAKEAAKKAANKAAKKARIEAENAPKNKKTKYSSVMVESKIAEETQLLDNIKNTIMENQPITEVLKPSFINKHHLLHLAVQNNSVISLQSLLQFGPKIDVFDNDHKTPLQIAVETENHELVQFLVENGASFKNIPLDSKTFGMILNHKTDKLDVSWIHEENVCSHITKVFPTFANKSYEKQYCIVFLLIAMLTNAYSDFCDIVIKGGKAIQLNFTAVHYPSDDIDVIIIPKYEYVDCKMIAQTAAQFIERVAGFSILDVPAPSNIMKISYKVGPAKYIALADIGYGYNELKAELREKLYKDFRTADFAGFGTIKYLPAGNLILEKIYYIYHYSASSPLFEKQSAHVRNNLEYIRSTNEKIDHQNAIIASLIKYKKSWKMDDVLNGMSDAYKEQFVGKNVEIIDRVIKQKLDNINIMKVGNLNKNGKIKGINGATHELKYGMDKYIKQFALMQREYMSTSYCVDNNPEHCIDIGNNHFLEKSREQLWYLAGILSGGTNQRDVMLRQFVHQYHSVFGGEPDVIMDTLIIHSILHHTWYKPAIYRKNTRGEQYLFR